MWTFERDDSSQGVVAARAACAASADGAESAEAVSLCIQDARFHMEWEEAEAPQCSSLQVGQLKSAGLGGRCEVKLCFFFPFI